jgi:hypothetical protein
MKSGTENINGFKTKMLYAALTFILLSGSCHKKAGSDAEHKSLIPEKEFISILTDFYVADGLLTLPEIRNKFLTKDSVSNYIDIIESHGYTYDAMNSTVNYYFIKKPKKLVRIYDHVLAILSEMESRYEKEEISVTATVQNIWQEKQYYEFPDTSGAASPGFSIILNSHCSYSFGFSVTIYPDDQTINPCFSAWLCNADSSETGKRTYLAGIKYLKDGQSHIYSITEENKFNYPVLLKGSILDFENNTDPGDIHARISNISFFLLGPAI